MAKQAFDKQAICLGVVVSAHGVKGLVRIRAFTENPKDIGAYGAVFFADDKVFNLDVRSVSKGLVLAAITGCNTREDAESIKGKPFYIHRHQLPATAEDEIYQTDLIGLDVISPMHGHLGAVTGIFNFGAGDMLEITPQAEISEKTFLVPFSPNCMLNIDKNALHLEVDSVWLPERRSSSD